MGPTANDLDASVLPSYLRRAGLVATAGIAALLGGCTTDLDTFFDQSKPIRAEATPTTVPILERIAAIEGPSDEYVEHDSIRPEDLRPEAADYRVSAGDQLEVRIWDIIVPGQPEVYPLLIDARGSVRIPQLGEIDVNGLTAEQIQGVVAERAVAFVLNPLVQVTVTQSRQQTFTALGMVGAQGTYFIPSADYRLLEALTVAGGIPETAPYIFVIRQIPLETQPTGADAGMAPPPAAGEPDGGALIDLIDDLTGDEGGAPALVSSTEGATRRRQPEQPAVDLVEGQQPASASQAEPAGSAWMFVNGKWVRTANAQDEASTGDTADAMVTQRVIRVPVKPLMAGDARYNMVIRPGDLIRVPAPAQGFVYMGGDIARPGSYTLPSVGPYTLQRAIVSAGGLGPAGVPERVDLTRMVGENRQATIMLNYRAIVEGSQPDIVMKPNDIVTIGTTFWAYPLAIIRGGFRTTYGFGFLLDRNFGNDVFGAPPTNFRN